jgi:hypothetical protein
MGTTSKRVMAALATLALAAGAGASGAAAGPAHPDGALGYADAPQRATSPHAQSARALRPGWVNLDALLRARRSAR